MAFQACYRWVAVIATCLPCLALATEETQARSELAESISDRTQAQITNNWYIAGSNQTITEANQYSAMQQYQLNGGYQHRFLNQFDLFVEAGVNSHFDDIATQRGFNMATGVSYKPVEGLTLESRFKHQRPEDKSSRQLDFELSSAFHLRETIAIKASYTISEKTFLPELEQQLQFGLGYRF